MCCVCGPCSWSNTRQQLLCLKNAQIEMKMKMKIDTNQTIKQAVNRFVCDAPFILSSRYKPRHIQQNDGLIHFHIAIRVIRIHSNRYHITVKGDDDKHTFHGRSAFFSLSRIGRKEQNQTTISGKKQIKLGSWNISK